MSKILTIFVSALIAVFSAIGVYRYAPLSILEGDITPRQLGSDITTINGSDRLTDSRTTINTNFANLNATKIENSTTSVASITTLSNLSSIGTITTGVWNGTPITVPYGGTGSTTLSSDQVLLGNGTGILKNVTGFGTTGQFLTSNGAGSAPSWQTSSIALGDNYNWTGVHNFLGTTLIKSLNASSTVIFNGVTYNFPATQGASSTALVTNGSGILSWGVPQITTGATTTAAGAVFTMVIEHGLGRIPNYIKIDVSTFVDGSDNSLIACQGTGTATSTASQYAMANGLSSTGKNCSTVVSVPAGKIIRMVNDTGTDRLVGNLSAVSTTDFTITITVNTTGTGDRQRNIIWTAY